MASNAYESIGGEDAAGMVQRAGLALTLERIIAERGLSAAAAAERVGNRRTDQVQASVRTCAVSESAAVVLTSSA